MSGQFDSSRLKIKRANRHIKDLEAVIQAFLKTDFYRLVNDVDPKTGHQLFKLQDISSPPTEISLIVGDAVHNLRSALDHAMVTILGKKGNQVAFPVAKNRDNPGAHSTYGIIKEALPDLANLLTNNIGIHDTGDACIWSISALDNIDKHNLLIAMASVYELRGISLEDKARNNRIDNMTVRVGPGGTVSLLQYGGGDMKIKSKGQAAAAVLFAKGQPLEGKPIVPTLLKLSEIALQAIQTLELFWFGKSKEGQPVVSG
jgi:hypothetical protein